MKLKLSTTEQDILILFSFYAILVFVSGAISALGVKLYQKLFRE
jgi:hypothetical protein